MKQVEHGSYALDGTIGRYGFRWGQKCRPGKTVVSARHWWTRTSDCQLAAGTCVRVGFGDLSDADLIRVANDLDGDEVWVVLSESDEFSSTPPVIAARSVFRAAEIVVRPWEISFVDMTPLFHHAFARRIDRAAVPALFSI